jgi:hypothetical protein
MLCPSSAVGGIWSYGVKQSKSDEIVPFGEKLPLFTICGHEAAHAVMRWLRDSPCTDLRAGEDGGVSVGTGDKIRNDDFLKILLAGYAWEWRNHLDDIDLPASKPDDLEQARMILTGTPHLRGVERTADGKWRALSVEEGLAVRFREVAELLAPYETLICEIATRLEHEGSLSAKDVRAMIRRWEKKTGAGGSPR